MRLFRLCAIALLLLSAACSKPEATTQTPDPKSQITKLEKGMTRDQIKAILGPRTRSLSAEGFAPTCDTFLYNTAIDAKFIHVWYVNGKLSSVIDRQNTVCVMI